jgi:hypothetical protein
MKLTTGKALPDICCSATFKAVNTPDKNFTRNNRGAIGGGRGEMPLVMHFYAKHAEYADIVVG